MCNLFYVSRSLLRDCVGQCCCCRRFKFQKFKQAPALSPQQQWPSVRLGLQPAGNGWLEAATLRTAAVQRTFGVWFREESSRTFLLSYRNRHNVVWEQIWEPQANLGANLRTYCCYWLSANLRTTSSHLVRLALEQPLTVTFTFAFVSYFCKFLFSAKFETFEHWMQQVFPSKPGPLKFSSDHFPRNCQILYIPDSLYHWFFSFLTKQLVF